VPSNSNSGLLPNESFNSLNVNGEYKRLQTGITKLYQVQTEKTWSSSGLGDDLEDENNEVCREK
jgi:hypothetical protein